MDRIKVRERYEQIVADEAERGEGRSDGAAPAGGAERRVTPRVAVVCADMTVNFQIPVSAVNLSAGGACFFSERPFTPGNRIELSIAAVFSVQATVVHCVMEETDSDLLEVHYRVHCQFDDEAEGRSLLVLAKEQESAL